MEFSKAWTRFQTRTAESAVAGGLWRPGADQERHREAIVRHGTATRKNGTKRNHPAAMGLSPKAYGDSAIKNINQSKFGYEHRNASGHRRIMFRDKSNRNVTIVDPKNPINNTHFRTKDAEAYIRRQGRRSGAELRRLDVQKLRGATKSPPAKTAQRGPGANTPAKRPTPKPSASLAKKQPPKPPGPPAPRSPKPPSSPVKRPSPKLPTPPIKKPAPQPIRPPIARPKAPPPPGRRPGR